MLGPKVHMSNKFAPPRFLAPGDRSRPFEVFSGLLQGIREAIPEWAVNMQLRSRVRQTADQWRDECRREHENVAHTKRER
jgi:hypothetical protein